MCILFQALNEIGRISYEQVVEKDTSLLGIFDIYFTENGIKIRFINEVKDYHFVKDKDLIPFPKDEQYAAVIMSEDFCNSIHFQLTEKKIKQKDQDIDNYVDTIIISRLLPEEKKFIEQRICL